MGKGNIYNDIQKGLYELAILEVESIKKQNIFLKYQCDSLIQLLESYKNGIKPKKKDYMPLLEKIIL
jgi:hypothetical protein